MIEIQHDELSQLLEKHTIGETAEALGVGRNTVVRRAKKFGISIKNQKPHIRSLPKNLTEDQLDVVIGTLLGDGSLWVNNERNSACYRFGQSSSRVEYVQYIKELMNPFSYSLKEDGSKKFFYTNACDVFTKIRKKWYPQGTKIVPYDIKLNERILYFWFMDDGCNQPWKKEALLYTNGFSEIENKFLCDRLWEDLQIKSSVQSVFSSKYNKRYFYLRVFCESYNKFMGIVFDAGPKFDCFDYKYITIAPPRKYRPKCSDGIWNKILIDYINGIRVRKISEAVGVSISTVERIVYSDPEYKLKRNQKKVGVENLGRDLTL